MVAEGDQGDDEHDINLFDENDESNDSEYVEGIEGHDALALNALVELDGADERIWLSQRQGSRQVQRQMKRERQGSQVSFLLSLNNVVRSCKCLRCGGIGHWAGDPECTFGESR